MERKVNLKQGPKMRTARVIHWLTITVLLTLTGCVVVDWVDSELFYSKVINAQSIPKFEIPPALPGTKYLRFIAVGDFGTGAKGQREVADAMAKKAKDDAISLVLVLGDNFYESGVESVMDEQWQTTFELMYNQPSLNVPFYAVLGNHDYRRNPQAQIEYARLSTRWKMPDRYYSFTKLINDSSSAEFFCLDTNPLAYLSLSEAKTLSDTSGPKKQLQWFARVLGESRARWKIVIGHHTIYSGGEHGDNETMQYLLEPLFTQYGVDFYVCGHDHDQELLKPIHGVTYIISGAGAKHRDVRWRDNTLYAETNLGFTFFRMSWREAVVEFLTRTGTIEYAHTFSK